MKSLYKNIIFTFVAFAFCYLFLGFYYEEYQGLFTGLYTGEYSPGTQFFAWYFMGDIGTSYIYSYLYKFFPNIEWVSIIYTFMIGISSVLLLQLFDFYLDKKLNKHQIFVIKVFFFILLFPMNLMYFNFTRVAYLLVGTAGLNIIIRYDQNISFVQNFKHLYLFILLYLLGSMTRVEPSMSISLLLLCFSVVWNNDILKGIKSSVILLFIAYSILVGIFINIQISDDFCKKAEPDIETSYGLNKLIPLSDMSNKIDSMKYEAAVNMLWGDPNNISIDFLRSLTKVKDIWEYRKDRFQISIHDLFNHWSLFNKTLLINFIFCIIIMIKVIRNKKKFWLQFLYSISIFVLLFAQIFFVKLTNRAFFPVLIIYTITVLLLFLKNQQNRRNTIGWIALFIFFIYLSLSNFFFVSYFEMKNYFTLNTEIAQKIQPTIHQQILLLNATTFGTYTNRFKPFEKINNDNTYKLYINEAQMMPLVNTYKDYLSKECNCDIHNFSAFYKYLLGPKQTKEVYTLSDEKRMNLISKYLKIMYRLDLNYVKVEKIQLPLTFKMSMAELYQPNLYRLISIHPLKE